MEADELLLTVGLQLFNILHLNCLFLKKIEFFKALGTCEGKKKGFLKTLRIVQGFKVVGHKKRLGICTSFRIMDIQKVLGRAEFRGFIYIKTLRIILIFKSKKIGYF